MPKTVATIGRIKNAMKATILPPCAAVMEGRSSNRPIRMILKVMTVATAYVAKDYFLSVDVGVDCSLDSSIPFRI